MFTLEYDCNSNFLIIDGKEELLISFYIMDREINDTPEDDEPIGNTNKRTN